MRYCLLLFFFIGFTSAFDVQLNYRCSNTQCTYYFVVPEIVAGYVDSKVLQSEVKSLQGSIETLQRVLNKAEDEEATSMTNFTQTVDAQYNVSSPIIINVTQAVINPQYQQSVQDLNTASANLIQVTSNLVSQMECYKEGSLPSNVCSKFPTTTAAPTTTPLPTTKVTVVTTRAPIVSSPTKPATQPVGGSTAKPTPKVTGTVDTSATTVTEVTSTAPSAASVASSAASVASSAASVASSDATSPKTAEVSTTPVSEEPGSPESSSSKSVSVSGEEEFEYV